MYDELAVERIKSIIKKASRLVIDTPDRNNEELWKQVPNLGMKHLSSAGMLKVERAIRQ